MIPERPAEHGCFRDGLCKTLINWGLGSYRPPGEAALNILQKYIFREWLWTFLAATVVLLIVMIVLALSELLNDIAGGQIPAGLLWTLIVLKLPEVIGTILPFAIFIAVIWGLGRLYRDQEMAVMRASGFHWRMLLRPLFRLLLPVFLLLLGVSLFLSPLAASTTQKKLEEAFRNAAEWGLQPGTFHVLRGGDMVLYVETVEKDGKTLDHVFIQQRNRQREQVWAAEKGYYWLDRETGARFLTLENGQITEGGRKSLDFQIMRFSRNDLRLPELRERNKPEALEAKRSKEIAFSSDPAEAAEMQWRLSPAIATLVLGLLAIPLSHSSPREGRGGRAVLGLLLYATYANVLNICRGWLAAGDLPVPLGMWWVHALLLMVALIWLQRQGRMVGRG
ncbi:MAG: LPS export ABC transporter permease LptF [Lysobacterales bacterium]|jgi:lipopolysaccharide export system permease protein